MRFIYADNEIDEGIASVLVVETLDLEPWEGKLVLPNPNLGIL